MPPPGPEAGAMPPPGPEAGAMPPPGPEAGAMPPPAAPIAENQDDLPWDTDPEDEKSHFKKPHNPNRTGRDSAKALSHAGLLKAIQMAKKAGAGLDTKLDFGHKEMTLHDCIRECGLTAMECGFEDDEESHGNPVEQMLKSIAGFWNKEERNFTIGGTRAKVKIIKDFKNGEFKGATPDDVKQVLALVDKMDPSSEHNQELGHIKHLSGIHGMHPQAVEIEIGEGGEEDDFAKMMNQFKQMHPNADINKMIQQVKSDPNGKFTQSNTSSGTVNGKPSNYDDAMKQMPKINFGGQDFDMNNPDDMHGKIKGMMGGMMGKMQGQAPNQNVQFPGGQMNPHDMMKGIMGNMKESDELTTMLKIAGLK